MCDNFFNNAAAGAFLARSPAGGCLSIRHIRPGFNLSPKMGWLPDSGRCILWETGAGCAFVARIRHINDFESG